jgi:hypothetical protein
LDRTKFVLSNRVAAKQLGGYSRAAWAGYLRNYLYLQPSLDGNGNLEARCVGIEWSEDLPGLILIHRVGKSTTTIGSLSIPEERSPLIYIEPIQGVDGEGRVIFAVGRYLIVSTMVGNDEMRGLMLTVNNLVANAFAPIAVPIVMPRLDREEKTTLAADPTLRKAAGASGAGPSPWTLQSCHRAAPQRRARVWSTERFDSPWCRKG